MKKVIENIYVGTTEDCFHDMRKDWAVVHACKHPCHKTAVGYKKNIQKSHKHYLTFVNGKHLYLNIIDTYSSFFPFELFEVSMRFISSFHKKGINVLVHCNKGESRSSSLILVYLAKETEYISRLEYDLAREDFYRLCPTHIPRIGIDKFLRENWKKLMDI